MTCAVCEHSDRTGSWVDAPGQEGLTHCRDCHASWPRASEMQHCTVCHETFTGISAADLHRRDGRCVNPAGVVDKHGTRRLVESTRRRNERVTITIWGHPSAESWWDR